MKYPLYLVIIFISAFLLFQIQPILTKELLPQFGGSSSVWSASMLFYQSLLLCGYLYAHGLSKLQLKHQFMLHGSLLVVSLFLTFNDAVAVMTDMFSPTIHVIFTLAAEIGLAFLLLASTSVLLQHWHIRTTTNPVPYHWYSLSNLASLSALISYPLMIEINFPVSIQKELWYGVFTCFAGLQCLLMLLLSRAKTTDTIPPPNIKAPLTRNNKIWLWMALSATGSIMLVATTQMISTNIPPMPLIWILPLVIYLTSYTCCFSSRTLYQRTYLLPFLLFSVLAGLMMYFIGSQFSAVAQLIMFSVILLICCLACHGELRLHAPEKESATVFYVAISAGGAAGSIFTALLAPMLFERITEYVLGLFLVLLLFALSGNSLNSKERTINIMVGWATAFMLFTVSYFSLNSLFSRYDIASERNFYGYVAVKDIQLGDIAERRLIDGTTVHGSQSLRGQHSNKNSYYQEDSGVAISLDYLKQKESLDIGIIGLGAGVLASYSEPDDRMSFYELNPGVYTMASQYFSYLKEARGSINVTIADGRLALKNRVKNADSSFNALVIDAFSSDVIPAHLLTQEAFELYWQSLNENGLLIIHISNNHIDLMPVLQAHSQYFNKTLVTFKKTGQQHLSFGSDWVVLTSDNEFVRSTAAKSTPLMPQTSDNETITWTDEHYSLLALIKY